MTKQLALPFGVTKVIDKHAGETSGLQSSVFLISHSSSGSQIFEANAGHGLSLKKLAEFNKAGPKETSQLKVKDVYYNPWTDSYEILLSQKTFYEGKSGLVEELSESEIVQLKGRAEGAQSSSVPLGKPAVRMLAPLGSPAAIAKGLAPPIRILADSTSLRFFNMQSQKLLDLEEHITVKPAH